MSTPRAVLLDLDGTLVDSLYQHVVTWGRALREHGHDVSLWRIHSGIGIDDLETREVPFLIATSAGAEKEALLGALGRPELDSTNADDVVSSKPAADLLDASVDELGVPAEAVTLVGDSPWDARAAARLGMRCIAVRCGDFGEGELRDAGAIDVVDAPRDLIGRL